jgi:hypothetical protein
MRTGLAHPGPAGGLRLYYGWWMVGGLSITELASWGALVYTFSVFHRAHGRPAGLVTPRSSRL